MNKILGIYKPKNWTSHDVIAKLRLVTGIKRIGHAGTLDPLAEGVLVIGIGREATKKLNIELAKEKEYEAVIKLGQTSATGDEEGVKKKIVIEKLPTEENIKEVLEMFVGEIEQKPHKFSAVKIGGRAAYKYARAGKSLVLSTRKVQIKNIELMSYNYPLVHLKVTTGPGVYIRVLAENIGERLGTGGYLFKLVRTRAGQFKINEALKLQGLTLEALEA